MGDKAVHNLGMSIVEAANSACREKGGNGKAKRLTYLCLEVRLETTLPSGAPSQGRQK